MSSKETVIQLDEEQGIVGQNLSDEKLEALTKAVEELTKKFPIDVVST